MICRLAALTGRPPSEIARWSADDVDVMQHFLAVEPSPVDRVEVAIAQLATLYVSAHQERGAKPPTIDQFLLFRHAFKPVVQEQRYSDVDLSLMKALGAKVH